MKDIFNGFRQSNFIYKRRVEGKNTVRLDQTSKLRFQLGLNGQGVLLQEETEKIPISNSATVQKNYYRAQNELALSLGIGYEIQKPLKERLELTYGIDVIGRYVTIDDDVTNLRLNNVDYDLALTEDNEFSHLRLGITPFLGFTYAINSYLYIGAETGLDIFYFSGTHTLVDLFPTRTEETVKNAGIKSIFVPIRFLNLSIRFN